MKFHYSIIFLLISFFFYETSGVLKITSAKCEVIDKETVNFDACKVKAISRDRTSITVSIKLNQTFPKINLSAALFKRANGWRPFLYSIDMELCQFLGNPKKNILAKIIYDLIKKNLNGANTCPLKAGNTISLDSFEMDGASLVKRFPIDTGEYALFTKWYFRNKLVMTIDVFASYMDYTLKN